MILRGLVDVPLASVTKNVDDPKKRWDALLAKNSGLFRFDKASVQTAFDK